MVLLVLAPARPPSLQIHRQVRHSGPVIIPELLGGGHLSASHRFGNADHRGRQLHRRRTPQRIPNLLGRRIAAAVFIGLEVNIRRESRQYLKLLGMQVPDPVPIHDAVTHQRSNIGPQQLDVCDLDLESSGVMGYESDRNAVTAKGSLSEVGASG